jgi:large subunit ribosomal protein L23
VFKVRTDATKAEIRQAVELLFEVKVDDVTVMNCRGKIKRHGGNSGCRVSWKKAYVKLAPGSQIDFLGAD